MINLKPIFNIQNRTDFEQIALEVFNHQFSNNRVYRSFCDLINRHPSDVDSINDIPFLPIEFFKSRQIVSGTSHVQKIFTSSGTTGNNTSKHFVTDLKVYEQSFRRGFEHVYGDIEDYVILALLPSYLEREGSSLIYMVNDLITNSKQKESGFYLHNLSELKTHLDTLEKSNRKILLIGVSFALLELVETYQFRLKNTIIMETGGMKGKRKEIIRTELHHILRAGFGVEEIHSEYGMTELLSQAYAKGSIFKTPPWMQILIRDTEDPLSILKHGKTGGINVIDLANINSCAFIATQDLGKLYDINQFEVLGRFDHSDIRGCNLMAL
ncbi:MAG: acyl transferase [Flavobacteriaceae bacterium]|nr:acyl transferase [Flavobacteriaceae bacterium]